MIQLEGISKYYRRGTETVRALDDVSLKVSAGQTALLRGPSGGGKTTLINLCAGLASPTTGSINVAGHAVHAMSQAQRAALRATTVSVIFQLFHLTPYLTARENIMLPALAAPIPDAAGRAAALLEELGIAHRAEHLPGEMSAGERQRCAVARATIGRPAVILADEPTGNLDAASAAIVLERLETCRAEGATVLLVSHHPVDIRRPDHVFALKYGRIMPAIS